MKLELGCITAPRGGAHWGKEKRPRREMAEIKRQTANRQPNMFDRVDFAGLKRH